MQGASPISSAAVAGLLQALVAALLMNVCIVGINQLYDIDIDRVNKPYLPLASGELSFSGGLAITCVTGAASLAVGLASGSMPLMITLLGSLALGLAYSVDLPLLRWKRHPAAAAACILAVRCEVDACKGCAVGLPGMLSCVRPVCQQQAVTGLPSTESRVVMENTWLCRAVLVQLGFFAHMKRMLGASTVLLTRPLVFATSFMLVFSIVIALFKDIPDVKGDVQVIPGSVISLYCYASHSSSLCRSCRLACGH